MTDKVAAIIIGRNEGERLIRCLKSLQDRAAPIVYVDSGSTDGSVTAAQTHGAEVVALDMSRPFTAARARNEGLARLAEIDPDGVFVQVLDGDCELQPGWIETAYDALLAEPDLAVVCGRRRERFPEATLWNRMIDAEWDTPVGEAIACGGDALMRRAALDEVGGYRADVIAGEEPEMCFRLRAKGWRIRRIDAEMTAHDAALTRASQWWKRARRAGHAFAEGAALHGASPERFRVKETRRALLWGAVLPVLIFIGLLIFGPWALVMALIYPLQMLRLWGKGWPIEQAVFVTLGKFPEAQGAIEYWVRRWTNRRRGIIEYK